MSKTLRITLFGLLSLFCFTTISAQNPLEISMKTGFVWGKLDIASKNITFTDKGSHSGTGNGALALSVSMPLKKNFRIGTEIGFTKFRELVSSEFNFSEQTTATYQGWYNINQAYFALIPEYRIKPWVYVNVGIGYFPAIKSQFETGYRSIYNGTGIGSEDITGWELYNHNSVGYLAGIGFCPKIRDGLSLLLECRYLNVPSQTRSPDQISASWGGVVLNGGLQYRLGGA